MQLPLYQVDAFTGRVFGGNPAAVVPMQRWPSDATLLAIAAENNLSETAFLLPRAGAGSDWDLRWYTPRVEMDLCGHATLASAHVILEHLEPEQRELRFHTRSGELRVRPVEDGLRMDLPAAKPEPVPTPEALTRALGRAPRECLASPAKYLALLDSEQEVRSVVPDAGALLELDRLGVIISAPGQAPDVDFVSRFFAPKAGILEDPVTGAAHCVSAPHWAERLGRQRLRARQVSQRGGELVCEVHGERVHLIGQAVTYLVGRIQVEPVELEAPLRTPS